MVLYTYPKNYTWHRIFAIRYEMFYQYNTITTIRACRWQGADSTDFQHTFLLILDITKKSQNPWNAWFMLTTAVVALKLFKNRFIKLKFGIISRSFVCNYNDVSFVFELNGSNFYTHRRFRTIVVLKYSYAEWHFSLCYFEVLLTMWFSPALIFLHFGNYVGFPFYSYSGLFTGDSHILSIDKTFLSISFMLPFDSSLKMQALCIQSLAVF